MIQPRSGQETLPPHLEARYGIQVDGMTELDLGVYRVGLLDGPDWVARVFAADRPLAAAEVTPRCSGALEQQEFPAERCAAQEPVPAHEGQGVLVTQYVEGTPADGSLVEDDPGPPGPLLGRLHALPSDHVHDGGAGITWSTRAARLPTSRPSGRCWTRWPPACPKTRSRGCRRCGPSWTVRTAAPACRRR